ncbi:MAG: endonuclease/exonuclease/phosphatase family protein [Candidatus Moranbacteria bacterium]|nr:endonuclease/exonuclease/phosphatase family protein [Candidatus Moranbacteria bacterium]
MNIVTLNTWGGRAGKEKLLDFFQQYRDTVDVFCLQEMWNGGHEVKGALAGGVVLQDIYPELLSEIEKKLSDHELNFQPQFRDYFGLALFVRKGLRVSDYGGMFVHKEEGYEEARDIGKHARKIQYVRIGEQDNPLTVINFHGLWNGEGKGDSEDRILQSQNIVDFLKEQKGEIIFCGDFNLKPDTKSLQMFEDFGLRNLITEYGITSTRTSLYTKPERFASYVFVSQGLQVADFKVLSEEVSDHAPLWLEIQDKIK